MCKLSAVIKANIIKMIIFNNVAFILDLLHFPHWSCPPPPPPSSSFSLQQNFPRIHQVLWVKGILELLHGLDAWRSQLLTQEASLSQTHPVLPGARAVHGQRSSVEDSTGHGGSEQMNSKPRICCWEALNLFAVFKIWSNVLENLAQQWRNDDMGGLSKVIEQMNQRRTKKEMNYAAKQSYTASWRWTIFQVSGAYGGSLRFSEVLQADALSVLQNSHEVSLLHG